MNKFRSNSNSEISSLVKTIIKLWKEAVKKKTSTGALTNDKKVAASGGVDSKKFVTKGVRTPLNDGIKTDLYDDSTRNSSVAGLYTALLFDSNLFPEEILDVSKKIENEIYKLEFMVVNDSYRKRLRSLILSFKNKKNPELRSNVLSGAIKPHELVKMSPQEMAPEALKKEIEKIHKQNLFDAQGAVEKRAISSSFTCGKCKQKKVSYYQLQTRSADEPLTTFCTCENCGNRWKMN